MGGKIKLLVVDDEREFLAALSQRLEFREFDVTAVTNGSEAIDAALEEDFDVALIDFKMPEMDGEELLHKLKKCDQFLEVIMLTGHGTIDSAIRSTKMGVFSYLHKPCPMDTLLHILKEAHRSRSKKIKEYKEGKSQEAAF